MSPEFRANLKTTVIIIVADLIINAGGVAAINHMRQSAMRNATIERKAEAEAAWQQRIDLTSSVVKACRK